MEHLSNADLVAAGLEHLRIADRCRVEVSDDIGLHPTVRGRLVDLGNQLERAAGVIHLLGARLG